ncbi:hypothetical protein DACRYDRAFT_21666 [Dacryopinax primogenitus]|uniref:Uncharacterized protein n=1 Tax=Dacryopinax primogenitus (strain DJM 731) TaxID=1858805 RepID=M5FXB5_DACPD|nr:uncharacterized protein DACRYDRAFT_21666 [Dacryopinax primogenitus]EJU02626.1 hypothetical protein DACRYDRAFT_21666 [Dacryopinax primogenitus]
MSAALVMPTPIPVPSPLDNFHLSLGGALPRVRRPRRASSYDQYTPSSSAVGTASTGESRSWENDYQLPQRPQTPRTLSTPILPHTRSMTAPSLLLATHTAYGHSAARMRTPPIRLNPLALAHMSRIAESAEVLVRHLHATLAKRPAASSPEDMPQDRPRAGESGLQLDLGPSREELVNGELYRATLLKGLASFRTSVDGMKRARHLGSAKRSAVHSVAPRRVFGASYGKTAAWRPRRGAVISLGGDELLPSSERGAWVEDIPDRQVEEMDVEELGERMGDIHLQD